MEPIDPASPLPLYRQIAGHFAARIDQGLLRPGDRLPSTQELARQYGVTVNTVQQALASLTRRGLLERSPRVGTTVSSRAGVRSVGLVFGRPVLGDPDQLAYARGWEGLLEACRRRNWLLRPPLIVPDQAGLDGVLDALDEDCLNGRIAGLFVMCRSQRLAEWLEDGCPVPAWEPFSCMMPNGVARVGIAHLLAAGYRRIGWIPPRPANRAGAEIAAACAAAGVPADAVATLPDANDELAGHALAHRLLAGGEPLPEVLLVGNDVACRGVLMGLAEAGIRIPRDLHLATHANRGIPIWPGADLCRIEQDPVAAAENGAAALERLLAGQPADAPALQPVLVPGASCPGPG